MSGLTAAQRLIAIGLEVVVLDKGRAVGGRMATKRFEGGRFDHGAQHFSARHPDFRSAVAHWVSQGTVAVWYESESITNPERGIEPRYVGVGSMRGICEQLAQGLDARTDVHVHSIAPADDGSASGSIVRTNKGAFETSAVVVTAPIPQARLMLQAFDLTSVHEIAYRPCLAALLVVEPGSALESGHLAPRHDVIAWIADNQHKGVSSQPAFTVHATGAYSSDHLEREPATWLPAMVAGVEKLTGARVSRAMGHRWRYSEAVETLAGGFATVSENPLIMVAGEALSGARIEGAFLSGSAAGAEMAERLSR